MSVVAPAASAFMLAPWITGPSAVGSENGIPSSIRSAPFATASLTIFAVVSKFGSPQVINGINEIGRASVGKECRSRWSPYH